MQKNWPSQLGLAAGVLLLLSGISVAVFAWQAESQCNPYSLSSEKVSPDRVEGNVTAFENLSSTQQRVFKQTLNRSDVPVSNAQANFFEDRTVRYRGEYYYLLVTHAECEELTPLFVGGGSLLAVLGAIFVLAGLYFRRRARAV